MFKHLLYSLAAFILCACNGAPGNYTATNTAAPMFPDYTDITLPYNIAPLNFMLRGGYSEIYAKAKCDADEIEASGSTELIWDEGDWHDFLQRNKGKNAQLNVYGKKDGKWFLFKSATWTIANEPIDSYISYRLIEPGYEVWNHIQICERNIESFDERVLIDNRDVDNSCMNCHTYGKKSGNLSFFHLRGKNGGTIINNDGKLKKLLLKDELNDPCIYGDFHPSGRFIVYTTNTIIPALHTKGAERLEVYDASSNLVVVDTKDNRIVTNKALSDSITFMSFPTFTPDGRKILFCGARKGEAADLPFLKYSLCCVSFDQVTGMPGDVVDTLYNAKENGHSVSFPKCSPDGKYILYTISDCGTFPIWHKEADLQMMAIASKKVNNLSETNSSNSDTYHSWSTNAHWFVFASKRDDGMYGKPYFAHVDDKGNVSKAFCLPQKHPTFYDNTFKSFNIPELSNTPANFNADDIKNVYFNTQAQKADILSITEDDSTATIDN